MRWQLRIDPTACTGHGLCADLLPERIELDEWGFPIIQRRRARAAWPDMLEAPSGPARRWRCG